MKMSFFFFFLACFLLAPRDSIVGDQVRLSILAFFEEFWPCLFRPNKLSNSSHLLVLFSSDVPPVASPASPVHCFASSASPQCRLCVHGLYQFQSLIALTLAQCTLIQRLAAMPTSVQHWRTLPPTFFFL